MTISTQFIAGPYSATWNSVASGMLKTGFEIRLKIEKNLVEESQLYGRSVLDAVYAGANCFCGFTLIEWSKAVLTGLLGPYGAAGGNVLFTTLGGLGTVGVMDSGSGYAKPLVLTSIAGTTAAASPATLTSAQTALAEGNDISWMMDLQNREVPIVLRLYPTTVGGTDRFFVQA